MAEGSGSAGLGKSVCVIGSGALGLVALKNLVEEGFDVTLFERNDYLGGTWHATMDETQTSVLPGTVSNVSKQGMAFSDFPLPEDCALHPTAKQLEDFLESYAEHFKLREHIKLSTTVVSIRHDNDNDQWLIHTRPTNSPSASPETNVFARLVMATGARSKPYQPHIPRLNEFKGEVTHSQSFKDASKYAGKTVLVVGLGATSADTISFLAQAGAKKIYVSHRRAFVVIPRVLKGKAIDHSFTMRITLIMSWVRWLAPDFSGRMLIKMMRGMQFGVWPELKDHKAFQTDRKLPHPGSVIPIVSDDLASNLLDGVAESVQDIAQISGPDSITLTDGTVLDGVEAVIFGTGMHADLFDLLPPSADPTSVLSAPDNLAALPQTYRECKRFPRLYRGFISLNYPHSLAFMGHSLFMRGAFGHYDLITMALAQLWSSQYPMPSKAEMEVEVDHHYAFVKTMLKEGDVANTGFYHDIKHDYWLNEVAGTGIYERVGNWTKLESWKLWCTDSKLYHILMDGPSSPHALRLFDTGRGRKAWSGAREALWTAYNEVKALEDSEKARLESEKAKAT